MSTKLSIIPCHENWFSMKENELGRFCESCSKNVIDFTKTDNKDISNYIEANSTQQICGRFRKEQIDLYNLYISESEFVKSSLVWHRFFLILLVVFGTELFHINVIFSQESISNLDTSQTHSIGNKSDTLLIKNDTIAKDSILQDRATICLKPLEINKLETVFIGDVTYISGSIISIDESESDLVNDLTILLPQLKFNSENQDRRKGEVKFSKLKQRRKKKKSINNLISKEFILPENIQVKAKY